MFFGELEAMVTLKVDDLGARGNAFSNRNIYSDNI